MITREKNCRIFLVLSFLVSLEKMIFSTYLQKREAVCALASLCSSSTALEDVLEAKGCADAKI